MMWIEGRTDEVFTRSCFELSGGRFSDIRSWMYTVSIVSQIRMKVSSVANIVSSSREEVTHRMLVSCQGAPPRSS